MLGRVLDFLKQYVKVETDYEIAYLPEGEELTKTVDKDKLVEVLKQHPNVENVSVSDRWVIVETNKKASRVISSIKDFLKERGFDVPVGWAGKYKLTIPTEFEKYMAEVDVVADVSRLSEGVPPLCVKVSKNTYPIKDFLKERGFKFDPLTSAWKKCFLTTDEAMAEIDTIVEYAADRVGVKVPKNIFTGIELKIKKLIDYIKLLVNRWKKEAKIWDVLADWFKRKAEESTASNTLEVVEIGEFKVLWIPDELKLCLKPKKWLEYEKFKEIRTEFKTKLNGDYSHSENAFCMKLSNDEFRDLAKKLKEEGVADPFMRMEFDGKKARENAEKFTKFLETFKP